MSIDLNNVAFSGARELNASVLNTKQQIADIQKEQKSSFLHSLTFKIITLGIGCIVSFIKSGIDEQRINQLKEGVKELHRKLDDVVCRKVDGEFQDEGFHIQMADETVHFRIDTSGQIFARMADDPEDKEYKLDATVEGLRYKLAEDIFAHPDLFDRNDLKRMLPIRDAKEHNRQQLSVEETYERRVFLLAIESRSNIRGDRLENITTANLRDLAVAALTFDGDADMVTEELAGLLDCFDKAISADRLTSIEAETMVQAFEEQVDAVKDTITIAPTMEKAPPSPPEGTVPIPQSYRNFIADFFAADLDAKKNLAPSVLNILTRNLDVLVEMFNDPAGLNELKTNLLKDENNQVNQLFAGAFDNIGKAITIFKARFPSLNGPITRESLEACIRDAFDDGYPQEKRTLGMVERFATRAALIPVVKKIGEVPGLAMAKVSATLESRMDDIFKSNPRSKTWDQLSTIDEMLEDAKAASGDSGYLNFVKTVLKNYFNDVPLQDKRAMVAAVIRYGRDGETEMEMFGAMLKGAGPLLQKMMQGLDDSYFTEDFKNIFLDMKKNLAPIDNKQIQAYLLDIKNRSGGKISSIEAKKSLGAASVGVVVDCTIHGKTPDDDRQVAVKMLRPDALVRIGREKNLMLEYAKGCKMEKSYEAQLKTVMGEFDFTEEVKNIHLGEIYNKGSKRVRSVKVDNVVAATPSTLVMEKAPGRTAADVVKDAREKIAELKNLAASNSEAAKIQLKALYEELERMHKDICKFAKLWLTEGIFGSGFFHGDLHGGNIMLDPEKGLTVLDFGNAMQLTKEQQENITRVIASTAAGHSAVDYFIDGFRELLTDQGRTFFDDKQAEIRALVDKVLSTGEKKDAGARIFIILSKLQEMGVEIPGPIFAFSQSQNRLETTIDNMTAVMEELRGTVSALPGVSMLGSSGPGEFYTNSLAYEFANSVRNEWIARENARQGTPPPLHLTPPEKKFKNLTEGHEREATRENGRKEISKRLTRSEFEVGTVNYLQLKKTIAQFRKMNVSGSEQLQKDYDAYVAGRELSTKSFEDVDKESLELVQGKELLRSIQASVDYRASPEDWRRNFRDAYDAAMAEVNSFAKVDKDTATKGFLAFLTANRLEASEADDSETEGSLAYYKLKIYDYLLDKEDGKSVVEDVDKKIPHERQKIVDARDNLEELRDKVVDGFMEVDFACFNRLHEEYQGLDKVLPKDRPDRFLDCVADVLMQHAVSALKRVGPALARLNQMA